ncbi:MAG: PQQ-dependent sugar dehydrogenase [Gammaproteobacteria bacterium]|nr:PQQ-dependent sugar dehydrogenase [Gammaproteobacteria bacterium]
MGTKALILGLTLSLAVAAAAARDYQLLPVAEGLDFPWCVAFLPDGGLLVTELGGTLRKVSPEGVLGDPIAGVPEVHHMSQGGLFDVLLHPDFERNQTLFLSYAAPPADDNATEILRARLVDGALVDGEVIFSVQPRKPTAVHYGGRMTFLPDGTLLLTSGDGFDFREASQDLGSLLGKTVRIHLDGSIPQDNPFIGHDGAHPAIYTYGHRNAQGLAVADDGTAYLNEHGPRGGDETNRLAPGANYGWPAVTYGIDYNGAYVSPFQEASGMAVPLNHWTPSIAPSGLAIYAGERFPEWRGDLFTGALVDGEVRRLEMEDGAAVGEEALFSELGRRIRDVRSHDGYLYVVEDGEDAQIWRVEPATERQATTSAPEQANTEPQPPES